MSRLVVGWTFLAILFFIHGASAQTTVGGRSEVFAGSELEEYLRYAQTMGSVPLYPWSLRAFSPSELDTLLTVTGRHPWSNRYDFSPRKKRFSVDYIRPTVSFRYNSAFPYGSNDGPVWAGRGLTTTFQTGVAVRAGPFSLTLAPEVFRAQNGNFDLMANGQTNRLAFGDGQYPEFIDRPQRFGNKPYGLFDPGQSTIRLDYRGVAVGATTANEIWGPADQYAYILSNNAAGIPRMFFGTSSPANLFLFRLHARLEWGILSQSHFSPVTGPRVITSFDEPGTRRFMSGLIVSAQPRGIDGLEVGVARFFHIGWREGGPNRTDFTKPLETFFKRGLRPEAPLPGLEDSLDVRENQLASVFARWALPGAGFEVYGEFGREDHSANLRDFLSEPDHGGASRMIGFRKSWRNGYALRAEGINFEAPTIRKFRAEGGVYLQGVLRQGHTERGQLLGADVGIGSGAGSTVALDRYSTDGRTTFFWSRSIGHATGLYYLTGIDQSQQSDVLHSLGSEVVRFVGPADVTAKLILTANLNRYSRSDVYNANLFFGVRYNY